MIDLKQLEVWFVTGSQSLYGAEALKQVALNAQQVVNALDRAQTIPTRIVFKPVVKTPEEAAVREIAEETGIRGSIMQQLGVIDYWFTGEDRRVHKVVHHFLLRAEGGELTVAGDPDGEAEDVAWVPVDELSERLAYPNERRLAAAARAVVVSGG